MANFKIVFQGTFRSETHESELECFATSNNEIFISIKDSYEQHICLDVSTAIKLAKTIRTQINQIKEGLNE